MLVIAFVLTVVTFICTSIAIHTHWFVAVATAGNGTMNVGFLLADKGDNTPRIVWPGGFCSQLSLSSTQSTCTDYETLVFALYLVWAVTLIFLGVAILATIKHMRWGLIMLVLSLTFQTAACFGFFFRVLGLQQKVAADHLKSAIVSWSFGWPSFVGGGSIFINFWAVLFFAITYRPADPPNEPEEEQPTQPQHLQQHGAVPLQHQHPHQQQQQQQQHPGYPETAAVAPSAAPAASSDEAARTSSVGVRPPTPRIASSSAAAASQYQPASQVPPPPPPPPHYFQQQPAPGYAPPQHQQLQVHH